MTKLTTADLPASFATLIIYGHNRLAFGAEHNSNLKPDAKVFQFSLDATNNELMRIRKVPMWEAFNPYLVKLGYTQHEDVAREALQELLKQAVAACAPPKPVTLKQRLKLSARKPG